MKFTVHGGTKLLNRTDFSVFNCQYSVFFGIPNTIVSIGISFFQISDIGSVFSVYRPMTSACSCILSSVVPTYNSLT